MTFRTYPKIETLFDRDKETFKVIEGKFRCPEFEAVNRWRLTEKIDGTNIRVGYDGKNVSFGGRSDNAQIPVPIWEYLTKTFTLDKLQATFKNVGEEADMDAAFKYPKMVVIFGEAYGPKIQKGGGNYRSDVAVRVFDILIDNIWLADSMVRDLCGQLGVNPVPDWGVLSTSQAVAFVEKRLCASEVAESENDMVILSEGIVARSEPLMLTRWGERVMWKLKVKDFQEGKR